MQQANIINSCVKIESFKKSMQKKREKRTTDRNNKTKSKAVDLNSGLLMTALNVNTLQITNKRQRLSHLDF